MKDERSSFWARAAHSACALKHGLLTSTGIAKRVRILGLECKTKGFVETMLVSW